MPPVDLDNASSADASAPQQDSNQNASAPSGDDLTEKYAAAQREASEWRGRAEARAEEINRLKRAISGDDEPETAEPTPATTNDLQTLKQEIQWELKNESQIQLANSNGKYDKYVAEGKSKQDALKLALFDEGITNSAAHAESMRQAQASSASQGIDRTGGDEPTAQEKADMERWGYSLETLRKHKAMKR